MTDLPGITSTTRTRDTDNERAKSLANVIILLTLVPSAKAISYRQ